MVRGIHFIPGILNYLRTGHLVNDSMGEKTRKVGKDRFRDFNGTSRYSIL